MTKQTSGKSDATKISDQNKRIESLKKSLSYYQEITDTVRQPFIILDKDLVVVTANHAFYKKFGVGELETEGQLVYELGNNQWDSKELRELLEDILPKHKFFNGFRVVHTFPEIGKRTMLLNARQVDAKQLILLAIEDITEREKLKKDTQKITKNLTKQKNDLKALSDSKDEFIMMASHQLRTPATIVKTYASMLHDGLEGDLSKGQMAMLDKAIAGNERQLEVIEDLLRVARVDEGKVYLEKSACDIGEMIVDVIKGQAGIYDDRKQKTLFKKPYKSTSTNLDPTLMRMVLENLLENASKYSREQQTIKIDLKHNKDTIVVEISDDGVGVDKKDQSRMFTKFSRIDNALSESTVGTGLGLYWVKKIIELHAGTIEVQSKVEIGTKFTITLPIIQKSSVPSEALLV